MSPLDSLVERMQAAGDKLMLAQAASLFSYSDLLSQMRSWQDHLARVPVGPGRIVSIEGEYSFEAISLFLALMANRNVVVPLSSDARAHHDAFVSIAEVEFRIDPLKGVAGLRATGQQTTHPLYQELRTRQHPGLVLFSSGSTGRPKAALHDLVVLLKKFQTPRHSYRTLVFLQLDHIGGVNTLLYTLSNAGTVVVPVERSPRAVSEAIATHKVELLPTSPTFLNLLLLSGEWKQWDLSSLMLITYGTEAMPESTLRKVVRAFPNTKLQQTYGLTEVGILRSQSRAANSLWVRVGGEGYETKIVNGRLWIRAESAMLGYLNAASPFDSQGFFDTGDFVEVDGEWLHILGRQSEIINVGGSKVHPAEVESALLELDNVSDAIVYGELHPLMGQIVAARVRLNEVEPLHEFKTRMRLFLKERLAAYKIPMRVTVSNTPLFSARFKRMRSATARSEDMI